LDVLVDVVVKEVDRVVVLLLVVSGKVSRPKYMNQEILAMLIQGGGARATETPASVVIKRLDICMLF
jgi:hypothetical protein